MNQIIIRKRERILKIRNTIKALEQKGIELNKEKLINILIVEDGISKKTAKEEVDAVMDYDG